jgi:hypothetical protein
MAVSVEAVPGRQRRWRLDGWRFPDLLAVAEWDGVLERRWWRRRCPRMEADVKGDDGKTVPAMAVCEGNEILPSDCGSPIYRVKYEQRFYVEPLWMDYQHRSYREPLMIVFFRQIKKPMLFFPFFFLFL